MIACTRGRDCDISLQLCSATAQRLMQSVMVSSNAAIGAWENKNYSKRIQIAAARES